VILDPTAGHIKAEGFEQGRKQQKPQKIFQIHRIEFAVVQKTNQQTEVYGDQVKEVHFNELTAEHRRGK
jgi:hypothetical protein